MEWDEIIYEKGDERFREPAYRKHFVQILLYLSAVLLLAFQISITLGILPKRFWYLPLLFFITGFFSYIMLYFVMEYSEEVETWKEKQ